MKHIVPLTAQSGDPELNAAYMQLITIIITQVLPLVETIINLKNPAPVRE